MRTHAHTQPYTQAGNKVSHTYYCGASTTLNFLVVRGARASLRLRAASRRTISGDSMTRSRVFSASSARRFLADEAGAASTFSLGAGVLK